MRFPPALSADDLFDLKCIRFRNAVLASQGCGDPACAPTTCLVARHARLIVRALDALTGALDAPSLDVRTDACEATTP